MGISQELVIHFRGGKKRPGSFFQLEGLSKIYEICGNGIHHVPFLRDIFLKNVHSQGSKRVSFEFLSWDIKHIWVDQLGVHLHGHQ